MQDVGVAESEPVKRNCQGLIRVEGNRGDFIMHFPVIMHFSTDGWRPDATEICVKVYIFRAAEPISEDKKAGLSTLPAKTLATDFLSNQMMRRLTPNA